MRMNMTLAASAALFIGVANLSSAHADVVVPVPDDNSQVLLRTDVITTQINYSIFQCRIANPRIPVGVVGRIEQGGCELLGYGQFNQPRSLMPGSYRLVYEGSFMDVELTPSQQVEIDMRKITVPRARSGTFMRVIWDLSDTSVQELLGQVTWERFSFVQDMTRSCNWAQSRWHGPGMLCNTFRNLNFAGWFKQAFRFNSNQTFQFLTFDGNNRSFWWQDYGWATVNEDWVDVGSRDGVVLVFPGRYSVVFNFADGTQRVQPGVVVQ